MKKKKLGVYLGIAVWIVSFVSCEKEELGIYFPEKMYPMDKSTYEKQEIEIIGLINEHRKSKALSLLKVSDTISSVALSHSKYMAATGQVNHSGFNSRSSYLRWFNKYHYVGETIAYNYATARGVVNSWLESQKHKEIMERKEITRIGIAIEMDRSGRSYYTLIVSG
jgi:uncharacterized protein YkwD